MSNAPEITEFLIPAQNEDAFDKLVARATKRAVANGLVGFVFTRTELELPSKDDAAIRELWVRKTLVGEPVLTVGDFTFVAALVGEEHGMVVHTAPGQSLVGWNRPGGDDQTCEHCNVVRDRKKLYVVRNNVTGAFVQIGSTCIELYLGLEVKGLWVLEFLDGLEQTVRGYGSEGARAELIVDVDRIIALAWAYSNEGRGYVSVANAQAWDKTPTGQMVRSHLAGPPVRAFYRGPSAEADYQADLADYLAKGELAAATQADEALMAAIKASAEALSVSDYAANLEIILKGDTVRNRNIGILASVVAVYARSRREAAEAKVAAETAVTGFLAPLVNAKGKATRVTDVVITLTRVREFDGDYGVRTLLAGTAANGMAVEWFATGAFSLTEGDTVTLAAASIKAHKAAGSDQYTKVDTTVLTRGRVA